MANILTERADQILDRTLNQLTTNTQIKRTTAGSKARSILAIVSSEIENLEGILAANMVLGLVNGASGIYLDFIGDLLGIDRGTQNPARTYRDEQNIKVSAPTGYLFGALNNGAPITVPSGTSITSKNGDIRFIMDEDLVLGPLDNEAFASAHAVNQGRDGNISAGLLSVLNFDGYAAQANTPLEVTNLSSIESGSIPDKDDYYRNRIKNALLSAESANETAVRLEILKIPSITDAIFLRRYRGIGTADIVVDSETGEVSGITMESINRAIGRTAAVGMDIKSRGPKRVGLSATLTAKFSAQSSVAIKIQAKTAIRAAIEALIASTPLGGSLRLNDIAEAARKAHPAIVDLGRPNKPIDDIVIWRDSQISGRAPFTLREQDISLEIDERLTLEGSLINAITIYEK